MISRTRQLTAALIAPALVGLFFLETSPRVYWSGPMFALYYVLAHICFWPPVLAAWYIARRWAIRSSMGVAGLVIGLSAAFTLVVGAFPFLALSRGYDWGAAVRDVATEAVAAAAGFLIYVAIAPRPNLRWSGP